MALSGPTASAHSRPARARFDTIARLPPARAPYFAECPELDCLHGRLPRHVLAAAALRSERLGIGADRVLIASGAIDEEEYVRALADHLAVAFEPLEEMPRSACPLSDERMIDLASFGLVHLACAGLPVVVAAPRLCGARRLSVAITRNPALAQSWRFTTNERLTEFFLRCAGRTLIGHAAEGLQRAAPAFSAASKKGRFRWMSALGAALILSAAAPKLAVGMAEVMLGGIFLGWLALRLAGIALPPRRTMPLPRVPDADLPVYTVIAALYREAASVDGLLCVIASLDYPREKLDVVLAMEADDDDTRAAIARRGTSLPVTVIPLEAGEPRTKPRALNAALPFAQGAFTVIFDAEDRPDPDQLRRAFAAFTQGGERLACAQARLTIDNTDDGWIAAMFTADYAGHFDVFLDGLEAMRLPIPLGGSSNHFRTHVLRHIGGWDAYNVTEDADLGLRLARSGFRTAMIASSTHEEAPAEFAPWLRQRTRWLKGWMQTWAVHTRSPRRLWRDLGPKGFVAVQLLIGGNARAALVHPFVLVGLLFALASGDGPWSSAGDPALTTLYLINLIVGYVGSALLGYIGLARRGLTRTAWVLALTPIHWLMLSLAAWRAVWQIITAPHRWEKTEHGRARHSRRAARRTAALLALEAELSRLKASGALPPV